MAIHFYGIPNCDTVKKARKWLDANGIEYTFHDYKKEGADPAKLTAWIAAKGWEAVLNKRGTTYRKLDEGDKAEIEAADNGSHDNGSHKAVMLMVQHPSMIKRPVVEYPGGILIGFKEDEWSALLS